MADPTDDLPSGDMTFEALSTALGERYLTYALSTITHRALPDARDGLKPVHRRILYAMRGLRLDPGTAFRKCAKIVGEVMGNYHPHGDQAIYDALARLAQDFNVRYPLVDGQGNFGNIDGDNPAAQRYTEARLTSAAAALMEGLAEDAVDFRDNYDGSEREPVVLPAGFPNLLANGSSGIAVGMATNIPPHNIDELCRACLHLIRAPGASDEKLLDFVQGPDFPTGGVIVEPRANIKEAYRTGRGSFRLRARWAVEDLGRGQWQVVVTEIPYQVQKGRLIERIAELINAKKVPVLADVRDESAEDLRIVLEPRARTVDAAVMMEMLFKASDLETRFALNMNVLIDGRTPKVCSLREVLRAFLDHRRDVLLRRSRFRLGKIEARLEILEGYLVAYLNLDRVIEIIRTEDEPKAVMMAEFHLTDTQAEAILNMRLRSLRRLEEMEIRGERDALTAEREALIALLGSEEAQWSRIADELREVRKAFGREAPGGARRTEFEDMPAVEDVAYEAMIEREPITVVCSEMGWIRAMKGHLPDDAELRFKDGDGPRFLIRAETTDRLLLLSSNGRMFTLSCANLPGGRGMGEPIRLMADLPNEARMVALFIHRPGGRLLLASDAGDGFILPEDEALAQTRGGRQVLNLRGEARAKVCRPVRGDHVAVVGENRKLLVFPAAELDEMARGKGTRLQRYKDGGLSDAITFDLAGGLSWKDPAGRTRTVTAADLAEWVGKRADAGRMAPRGFPQNNRFE
ncbi:DNA topoisomerase IV subunit A [Amaricoccus solimangrovi]|uniref:DNA topoisomerase 4 subunit A n=1 Tax=Amaricoccus solimangrovi TaxID=2589815 RepID=A0A501WHT1_9RHOB|nr:DNA topoisomerase IV subunit A [Amaricoccus solimangrovi]TPE49443.1 DNA topoisomerase IV subunit A [Amaricoccus solimangrovi]